MCASEHVCVTHSEGSRDTERRKGGHNAGSRHLSVRGGGCTIQISPSLHRQQTQRALWGEDKHPIDFRFENRKCAVYKLTLGEW